jgi:membrane protease YdiL (CAAX protease family)
VRIVKARLGSPVGDVAASPAAWFFGLVWLAALGGLAARGYPGRALGAPLVLVPILLFCLATVLLTEDPPPPDVSARPSRPRLLAQTASVLAIAVLIGLAAMAVYGVGPPALAAIPVWSGLVDWLLALGRALPFPAPAAISSPVIDIVIPGAILLLLGARPRELGFAPGHRVGRVLALWCLPQLAFVLISLITRGGQPLQLAFLFIRNGFQNGLSEEFLFRGALQTRLTLLVGAGWGLVLGSLAFGFWHVGTDARLVTHGDLLSAAFVGIASQAPYGLAFGVIFQRTRNLLAGSLFHMLVDLP